MAWESRRRKRYYYVKRWRDGTCTSEYVGRGTVAELRAHVDDMERHTRAMARLDWLHVCQGLWCRDREQLDSPMV
jgi:hypothetical protein